MNNRKHIIGDITWALIFCAIIIGGAILLDWWHLT